VCFLARLADHQGHGMRIVLTNDYIEGRHVSTSIPDPKAHYPLVLFAWTLGRDNGRMHRPKPFIQDFETRTIESLDEVRGSKISCCQPGRQTWWPEMSITQHVGLMKLGCGVLAAFRPGVQLLL